MGIYNPVTDITEMTRPADLPASGFLCVHMEGKVDLSGIVCLLVWVIAAALAACRHSIHEH